jgi:dTDP-4-amino-4,6-dideoxygalactose transaminase
MAGALVRIPIVDLGAQHREIADEVRRGFEEVIRRTAFILGPEVAEFEKEFARYSQVSHCVGVGNGTDALELILRASGIGPGDDVILPANTFVATALAVARAGATPVLVDADPRYYLIDPAQIESRIGPRSRAIIAVHLCGQIAPMEELEAIAREANLLLFEDAAQAQGARRHGRAAGNFGLAAGTSFYPSKNLGAYGDAGAVLTNDSAIANRIRGLRSYGSERKYHHPEAGFNSRLDTLQAVVLLAKLRRLEAWNEARRRAAERYHALLKEMAATLPETLPGNEHVWHFYVVRVPERDRVLKELNEAGVEAAVHYPVPVHLQGAFSHLGYVKGSFPHTEQASEEILSLPLFPGITEEQQTRVAELLRKAIHGG